MADADLENALRWFLAFVSDGDWRRRVAAIEENIERGIQPKAHDFQGGDYVPIYSGTDRIGWYLYLLDAAQHAPLKYEPLQGSRVIPVFKRLGADLDLLKGIVGVEDRVGRLLDAERSQPDGGLFELIIALLWKTQRLLDGGVHSRNFTAKDPRFPGLFRRRASGSSNASDCGKAQNTASEKGRSGWLCGRGSWSTSLAKGSPSSLR